jgi:hypothetical protein
LLAKFLTVTGEKIHLVGCETLAIAEKKEVLNGGWLNKIRARRKF